MVKEECMDIAAADADETSFLANDAKLHAGMCRALHPVVARVLAVFPFIEAARPRSKSGIQALCALHVALDKAKSLLRHCSECSKLYLAITADTVLMKFERAKCALEESLRRVGDIVTEDIGRQILEIIVELEDTVFALDQHEKEAGDEVVQLLQRSMRAAESDSGELEAFHLAALKLGISSSRSALTERRALKRMIERARAEGDKRKESVVSYLYKLMGKYSKFFRNDAGEDTDSQGSSPCSPTVLFLDDACARHLSKLQSFSTARNTSFNIRTASPRFAGAAVPPEELRCPISLQLMYDPVIIASGQTYERACIEKWFAEGRGTCPKTQQQLAHLFLTPNYCVKALVASWCEQNDYPVPDGPPASFDAHWRPTSSDSEPMTASVCAESFPGASALNGESEGSEIIEGDEELLVMLQESRGIRKKCRLVEEIRYLLKDDEEARVRLAATGFAEALVDFLRLAVYDGDEKAQEVGSMALFNLAVNNNRNKELLLAGGVADLVEQMISNPRLSEPATALYLSLSSLPDAKPIIGSSARAVSFLVQLLYDKGGVGVSCRHDALHTLYSLSTLPTNIPSLVASGIVDGLHHLLAQPADPDSDGLYWAEKALAVLISLASTQAGRRAVLQSAGLVGVLTSLLDTGEPTEQEQAVACLLVMCDGDEKCIHAVLQEGVVPALVSISVNGTPRGREKAARLLKLFRDHRQQRDSPPPAQVQDAAAAAAAQGIMQEVRPAMCKTKSTKLGRTLSTLWKNRSFSLYQC